MTITGPNLGAAARSELLNDVGIHGVAVVAGADPDMLDTLDGLTYIVQALCAEIAALGERTAAESGAAAVSLATVRRDVGVIIGKVQALALAVHRKS